MNPFEFVSIIYCIIYNNKSQQKDVLTKRHYKSFENTPNTYGTHMYEQIQYTTKKVACQ